ncbi:hypothetical protein TCAL_15134 [Tigriopus californicus]|uniref:Uncharacterized protein n=1 Tax=Tigriopus californicus TaxID=6832 RepID=A0A553NVR9_TIGCA|nr:hypothetical protein TCAL_15134 [Tigriopus californicus]
MLDQLGVVQAVALKLPPFWRHTPQVWFLQTETIRRSGVNQDTATRLLDLLQNPPVDGRYKKLKKRLLTFGLTDEERFDRLLSISTLGTGKQLFCA